MGDSFDLDYRLGERLGRGQFGAVYKCVSVSTGKDFAVKIIDKFSGCFDRQLVYSEIKFTLLAAFKNPRSVQIHQVYEDITAIYLILDLCPGPDLFDRIGGHGPFNESEAAALITELVESIAECHRRGLAHRDIKPENILFDSKGHLLLADFCCAALFEKGARSLKGKVGTPAYAAPEVLAGQNYDEKVDVWSAGVVLYLMLGWTLPFNGNSVEDIVAAVKKGDPICFPKEFFPRLSPEAKDLIEQMLERDPVMRLSAEQVLRLSHWRLLGRGQFGIVYQCVFVSTSEDFVVKIIDKVSGCFNRQLFYSEIKFTCLAAFENPRSVQIHQVYEDTIAIYLILDLCPGLDLFDCIGSYDPFNESEATALISVLMPPPRITHRDIKPENILFDSKGHLLLTDFGYAALFEKGARTLKGKMGTPAYAAPEFNGKSMEEIVAAVKK
ncbi:hypothetical protein M5K25_008168 [Dendrobium thyrsiflorum]|uniref:Protein kinase domain-containing protein n=1 Tax=Dendrobium thyrsiflorum TaxID=117978 RepID=A0ABD0V946_DENTH